MAGTKQNPKRAITTMRLPVELLKRAETAAKSEGRTRSNMIEQYIREGVSRHAKRAGVLG